MTRWRPLGGGLAAILLLVASCGLAQSTEQRGTLIAARLVLGGPADCPTLPFCLKDLRERYGLRFKAFRALDAQGPLTKAALDRGDIQVARLLSSDGAIPANGYVVLNDDKRLAIANNVVPIARANLAAEAQGVLDELNGRLTTADLAAMNKSAETDGRAPDRVAAEYLQKSGLKPTTSSRKGKITVGGLNTSESVILAQLYGQALKGLGYEVSFRLDLGAREEVEPALERGDIDLYPGYAASELEFLNRGKGEARTDISATIDRLDQYLRPKGLIALTPSRAQDQPAFVVTKQTADRYHLVDLSDLSRRV